jgi:hypothetical protein
MIPGLGSAGQTAAGGRRWGFLPTGERTRDLMDPLPFTPAGPDGRPPAPGVLSREAVERSAEAGQENSCWIDGVFTLYRKAGPGLTFDVVLDESQAAGLVEDPATLAALPPGGVGGHSGEGTRVVGRYVAGKALAQRPRTAAEAGGGSTSAWWAIVDDARLRAFVEKAARFLEARLDCLGRWSSFADWARRETGADLTTAQPGLVTPLDYWWLAGGTGQSEAVHGLPVYAAEYGLYVPPDDGLIRVYSCMVKASLAEAAYSASLGIPIKSSPLPCLGCLMGVAAQTLGRETVRGALLDERWRIEFAVCEEHGPERPAHYSVFDRDEVYDLVGCPDEGTVPVWIRRSWNDAPAHDMAAWA